MSNSKHSTRTDAAAPRLEVLMSWWGMSGLDEPGREEDIERRVERIAAAGFDGINGALPAPERQELWDRLLQRYNLSLSINAYPRTAAEMTDCLEQAKQHGNIQHINVQVMTPFIMDEAAVSLLRDLVELSRGSGIPAYIETHRGTITQDLIRTAQYVRRLEELRLTIDFSHYVVAGEMHTVSEEAESLLQLLLARTSAIHGRVSNGEQVQIDIGEQGEHPMLEYFERWWQTGMRSWLASAAPGDVLPFVCELGPPPYAITTGASPGGEEISDRWGQSLLLQAAARRIWKAATL
ncbi:sugar phosphate isomerase/epimerase family protein [Paenibacillus sp. 1P07SE]|uniref:sugar phosphate isomerase/epimerase family protein n=1 Tax=Paenibacillus sp. 1P07SE TaxID=3132209 RepID=UPI0039A72F5C